MENSKEISKTDRITFNSIGYIDCTKDEGKNKASLGERFTPIVLFYAFIIQLQLVFAQKKNLRKRATGGKRENKGKRAKTPPPHISYQRLAIFFITATFCQKFPGKRERMETNEIQKKNVIENYPVISFFFQ